MEDKRIHALILDVCIYIFMICTCIREFIMCDVVYLIFLDEGFIDHPWRISDDLINPSTMPGRFKPDLMMMIDA